MLKNRFHRSTSDVKSKSKKKLNFQKGFWETCKTLCISGFLPYLFPLKFPHLPYSGYTLDRQKQYKQYARDDVVYLSQTEDCLYFF